MTQKSLVCVHNPVPTHCIFETNFPQSSSVKEKLNNGSGDRGGFNRAEPSCLSSTLFNPCPYALY